MAEAEQKLIDRKVQLEISDSEMPPAALAARRHDAAWAIIQADPELADARRKLSIHELRQMIRAIVSVLAP